MEPQSFVISLLSYILCHLSSVLCPLSHLLRLRQARGETPASCLKRVAPYAWRSPFRPVRISTVKAVMWQKPSAQNTGT